ncbi:MAG TPA: hypothetical protein VF698_21315 [Thermoanaerobaculia bacterium]
MKRLAVALPVLVALLLPAACAPADKTPAPLIPEWDAVPAMIVDNLCTRLRSERLALGEIVILKTTQPLIRASAMAGLAERAAKRSSPAMLASQYAGYQQVIAVTVPTSGCGWRAIDVSQASQVRDVMAVELSSPLPNPFARKQAGLFARVSLAGAHASWYWIPLRWNGAAWDLGPVMPLGVWE